MLNIRRVMSRKSQYDNKGFTLIELVIVIAIVSILVAIAIPSFIGYVETANRRVCNLNCLQLEQSYNEYLAIEKIRHSEETVITFLKDNNKICPKHGVISYEEEIFRCGIHLNEDQKEDDDDEVPYL